MAKKIVLIHGLGGSDDKTWGKFPELLEADEDLNVEVVSVGYESPHTLMFWKRAPSIVNIANGLITEIKCKCDLENDEIIFAGHSLGGIVLKKLLLILHDKGDLKKIRKVCFFDVPHDGSGYANVGKFVKFRNRHIKSLCRDSSELDDLNDQLIASNLMDRLQILSIVSANDDIVSSSSSKSIFREFEVVSINNVDHRTIVKPDSFDSTVYIAFKKFIEEKGDLRPYKNEASRDLNDWKALEIRSHNYNFASDTTRRINLESLIDAIKIEGSVVRLTGASGLGKTRLVLEAIARSQEILHEDRVVIFDAPGYENKIKEAIRRMVEDGVFALIIVENCDASLHNKIAAEVKKQKVPLRVLTVGYAHEQVDLSVEINLLPLSDSAIKEILLPILSDMNATEISRIAQFAQGYPLMATLIADQYQREGRLLGSIESSSVVKKLIDGDNGVSDEEKSVLSACSLFDVFGTSEGAAGEEARYIAENVAKSDRKTFDRVLKIFTSRQIIHRAGRYARVIPKPLALTLASEWWAEASYERQKELVDTLPGSLFQSFCIQASYLDELPSIQKFSDRLFLDRSPFALAEELFTERGSRLFRAFVEVNPKATSEALYRILNNASPEELERIKGDTRRNLVGGLEKLCFHAEEFEKSAWCMLLLASAENESWSNNATGIFSQLFRVNLSGTQASPDARFNIIKRGLDLNQLSVDLVLIKALGEAINTRGSTRTVGAEYQGTKAPLQEWKPKTYQEVFDYWNESFEFLLNIFERGGVRSKNVITEVGHSLRGFISLNRLEMLDKAIREIIAINGPFWPEALDSLKSYLEFDCEEGDHEKRNMVTSWLELLNPENADLSEKLKIIVSRPPWEHRRDDSGNYYDVAAENAEALAKKVANQTDDIISNLHMLLEGEQNQAFAFGRQLTIEASDIQKILNSALSKIKEIESPNSRLLQGIYTGIYQTSEEKWEECIDRLRKDPQLVFLFPELIRTGKITSSHLEAILYLIDSGKLTPLSTNVLSYGSVLDHLQPKVVFEFCERLSRFSEQSKWIALGIIYMFCHGNKAHFGYLSEDLRKFIVSIPLHTGQSNSVVDFHQWKDLAAKLLKSGDSLFAADLVRQILTANRLELKYGDVRGYVKPLLVELVERHGEHLWPILSQEILTSRGIERYRLKELLDREQSFDENEPSVLSKLPTKAVIDWCKANPDIGPKFVAECVNIFEEEDEKKVPSPLFVALLENFGDDEEIGKEFVANLASRGWSGSLVPYLISDREALNGLSAHNNRNVRRWINNYIAYVDRKIEEESSRDDEMDMKFYQ